MRVNEYLQPCKKEQIMSEMIQNMEEYFSEFITLMFYINVNVCSG